MQTFLPYHQFDASAMCLDDKRLGKQRAECVQILRALAFEEYGWKNHPAVKMWRGYELALSLYAVEICNEWRRRGFNDKTGDSITEFVRLAPKCELVFPPWLGDETIHSSHRANLLRKDPDWYGQFGWDEEPVEGYVWPV